MTLQKLAEHYAAVINSPPNALGQHTCACHGQSHNLLAYIIKQYDDEEAVATALYDAAVKEGRKNKQ